MKKNNNKILISVGRQFGSGGRLIAMKLAEKLGIKAYNNELISKAAEQSGFSEDLFVKTDEKRSIFSLSSFFSVNRYSTGDNYASENKLFEIQSTVIEQIANEGSAVFVGRCSDYILRNHHCMSVFITSPEECRIKRIASRANISAEEAAIQIRRIDKTREAYYNYFTLGNWGFGSTYNLCIDSSKLGIDGTADLIIEFGKKAGFIPEK